MQGDISLPLSVFRCSDQSLVVLPFSTTDNFTCQKKGVPSPRVFERNVCWGRGNKVFEFDIKGNSSEKEKKLLLKRKVFLTPRRKEIISFFVSVASYLLCLGTT